MAPGRVDRRVVQRHLIALREAVSRLRRHAGVAVPSLRADRDRLWTIERGLQLAAQNALDIASHINSAVGQDPATGRFGPARQVDAADIDLSPGDGQAGSHEQQ